MRLVEHAWTRLALVVAVTTLVACGGADDDDSNTAATDAPVTSAAPRTTTNSVTATTAPAVPDLAAARITLTEVAHELASPVAFATRADDDRFYVAEQGGRVRIVEHGQTVEDPVLEIEVSGGNEQGLLGLVFSPDGTKLYVDYTDPRGDTRVAEYSMDGDVADTASRRELLLVDQPYPNHNGGEVTFGRDGMLYITLGDGGSEGDPQERAQNLGELFGKILRIDPAPSGNAPYSIPADNPFVGRAGARPEVWMYGLRNPWRFSFDRATDDVWIGDVGQNAWEEIDFAAAGTGAGSNWGWNAREGTHKYEGPAPTGARDPIFELSHSDGNCAVTGGYVYRGAAIPALRGAYVFADYCVGELTALVQRDGVLADQALLGAATSEVTSFGEDAAGELYVLSRSGSIFRIDPA
jgi:glucose/arabinose dehydrogenase